MFFSFFVSPFSSIFLFIYLSFVCLETGFLYVSLCGLELRYLAACASLMLGLKVCSTTSAPPALKHRFIA